MSATPITEGTAYPEYFDQGLPFDGGTIAVDVSSPIAYYDTGLPFTANSRIAVTTLPPVRWDADAVPYGANDRVAMSEDPVSHYSSKLPYTIDGAWAVDSIDPNQGVEIADQPDSISVTEGFPAVFMVVAVSGNGSPLFYQWQAYNGSMWVDLTDGGTISGTTTDTLTIDPVTLGETGVQFRVVVTNSVDSKTSSIATLTVTALETFYVLTEAGDRVLTEASDFVLTEEAA